MQDWPGQASVDLRLNFQEVKKAEEVETFEGSTLELERHLTSLETDKASL